jgi:hypothetical protein
MVQKSWEIGMRRLPVQYLASHLTVNPVVEDPPLSLSLLGRLSATAFTFKTQPVGYEQRKDVVFLCGEDGWVR